MPPTTTTTKASPIATRSRPRLAGSRGSCRAPPSPARNAPSANTAVNSSDWFTPSAPTISRSWVAARIRMPKRVRVSIHHSSPSTSGPMTISTRSYCGNDRPEDLDRAAQARCARPQQVFAAPDGQRRVADDQHQREGGQQLEQLGSAIDPPQHQPFRSARRSVRPPAPPAARPARSRRCAGPPSGPSSSQLTIVYARYTPSM